MSEWISTAERLPNNDNAILLWNGECVFQGWAEQDEDSDKYDIFYFGGRQIAGPVTHWMSLPAPPQNKQI